MSDWKTVYHNLDPKEPLEAHDHRLARALYTNEFFQDVKDELELNGGTDYKSCSPAIPVAASPRSSISWPPIRK